MESLSVLGQLGFSDRDTVVYAFLLSHGASTVKRLTKETRLVHASVRSSLSALEKAGLVSAYQKHKKLTYAAEDPDKLFEVLGAREREIASLRRDVSRLVPSLKLLHASAGKPTVKYYEGRKGVTIILKDVLATVGEGAEKSYRVYSSAALRDALYRDFSGFTRERIARRISVRVIAIGEGGDEQPLSERRWMPHGEAAPSYVLIYGGKVAFISLGERGEPIGVILEDERIAETQRIVFEHAWHALSQVDGSAARERSFAGEPS